MNQHLFLSYSRQQFYFAESLAIHLQQQGISIWFDIQQLEPGKDWADDIQQGLLECTGVVLLASRAALASPYVQLEWEAALKAGKPVYVVLFEAVSLPNALLSLPIFDFRADFNRGVERLAKSIRGEAEVYDRIPASNPLYLPTRLPRAVLHVTAAIFLVGLVTLWGASGVHDLFPWYFPNEFVNSVTLAYAIFSLYIMYQAWRFIRRQRVDFVRVYLYLFAVAGFITGGLTAFNVCLNLNLPHSPRYWVTAIVFIIAPILLGWFWWRGAGLISNSPDILRWMPTGDASQDLRFWLNRGQRARIIEVPPSPKVFRLHYHVADSRIASQIKHVLEKHGFRLAGEDEDVGLHIAVVSNFTAQSEASQLPNAINIVASGINIPGNIHQLNAIQWVDYRTRSQQQLHALGEFLQEAADGRKDQRFYSLSVVPESLNKMVMPNGVRLFTYFLAGLASGYMGVGLFGLLGTLFNMDVSATTIVGIPLGIIFFVLRSAVLNRRIIPTWIPIILIACAVISILLQVRFETFEAAILYIPVGALMVFYWDSLRNWLPFTTPSFKGTPTLAASTWKPIWRLNIVFIVLNLLLMALPFGLRSTGPAQIAEAIFDPTQRGPQPTATLSSFRQTQQALTPSALPINTPDPTLVAISTLGESEVSLQNIEFQKPPIFGLEFFPENADELTERLGDMSVRMRAAGLEWSSYFLPTPDSSMAVSVWLFEESTTTKTPDELVLQTVAGMMSENPEIVWVKDETREIGTLRVHKVILDTPAGMPNGADQTEWFVSVQDGSEYVFYIFGNTSTMTQHTPELEAMLSSMRPPEG